MKLETLLETPIKNLPVAAKKHIADDMEDVSRLAMDVSNAIYSGTDRDVERAWADFMHLTKRTISQFNQ